MRVRVSVLLALAATLLAAPGAHGATRAGVAVVDATWHVGASAGQFTEDVGPLGAEGVDPFLHSVKKRISDGVAVRTSVRAIVMADAQGDRLAIVSQDLYLSQDLLNRRVATLLALHDRDVAAGRVKGRPTGITGDNLAITASHNHNTPFYSTPGWGTAIFQDVIDVRFYDYMARRLAEAVIKASQDMVPVRMGGATRTFDAVQGHTYGPKVADDGTPAGQPYSHTTRRLSVVRLDDVSNPRKPKPMVNWVIFGLHPEFTWGYDLINGDFTHATARMVDRELGTTSVFSQRETGASGPHKDLRVHKPSDRREFEDNGFGQLDRGSRMIADAILAAHRDIERGRPQHPEAFQPFVEDFDLSSTAQRFAPPATRPFPGISNCNTAAYFHGDPRLPVLGLPDCFSVGDNTGLSPVFEALMPATGPLYDGLKQLGVPIPETISGTALTGVEETAAVRLQAFRLGDVIATFCPCEQFTDTALNIESRLDRVEGNIWTGFDWTQQKTPAGRDWCVQGEDKKWTCADPTRPARDLKPIDDVAYRRMRAQIHNDARGWETDAATLGSEAEPADPAKIKGNFTHEEHPQHGYRLALSVGMANDYWGYVPEYREMRSHDHYRKALNGLGAHGSDFLATRLARMGASLNGGPPVPVSALDRVFDTVESARAQVIADALGVVGGLATAAFERILPADGPAPRITDEPDDVQRFGAAHVSWYGGSNWSDLPDVRVQRRVGSTWKPYGTMDGDVQLMLRFPKLAQVGDALQGTFPWRWTAAFEAFSSDIAQPSADGVSRRATPRGVYRFVIEGRRRPAAGRQATPYKLVSKSFRVTPWDGLEIERVRVEKTGRVAISVGPTGHRKVGQHTYDAGPVDYPDSYRSPFRFLDGKQRVFTYGSEDPAQHQLYCQRCSFRPWADAGRATKATVTIVKRNGKRVRAAAKLRGGVLKTTRRLRRGERAYVAAGAVKDATGNTNAKRSKTVRRR